MLRTTRQPSETGSTRQKEKYRHGIHIRLLNPRRLLDAGTCRHPNAKRPGLPDLRRQSLPNLGHQGLLDPSDRALLDLGGGDHSEAALSPYRRITTNKSDDDHQIRLPDRLTWAADAPPMTVMDPATPG